MLVSSDSSKWPHQLKSTIESEKEAKDIKIIVAIIVEVKDCFDSVLEKY